jgi:hypothetical protein
MRRTVLVLTVGGVLLTAGACGTARHAGTTAAPAPVVAQSAVAAGQPAAQTETKAFCEGLGDVYNKNMGPFAEALTKMVAAGGAKASQAQAAQKLSAFATAVRGAAATSQDPQLRADGKQAADQLQAKSADSALFAKVKTTADVNTILGPTLKEWLAPVAHHCS